MTTIRQNRTLFPFVGFNVNLCSEQPYCKLESSPSGGLGGGQELAAGTPVRALRNRRNTSGDCFFGGKKPGLPDLVGTMVRGNPVPASATTVTGFGG